MTIYILDMKTPDNNGNKNQLGEEQKKTTAITVSSKLFINPK